MGRNKSSWYKIAQCIIKEYPANKEEYNEIMLDLTSLSGGGDDIRVQTSGLSDRTASAGIAAASDERRARLKANIDAVEYALKIINMREDGDLCRRYINARYWSGLYTPDGAAMSVFISARQGQRINQEFVRLVAQKAGEI